MDSREERVARNEAMFRAVNREIEHAAEELGEGPSNELELICECGQPNCNATVVLTIADYDEIHRQPDRFAVAPGHEDRAIEHIVKATDGYLIVDKFGDAEAAAE